MAAGPFESKISAQIEKLKTVKANLPFELANIGQNHFSRSFQQSEWQGEEWEPRAKETKKSIGKHLLVASGRLRASIFHCIRKYDWQEIVWGTDIPYARYHNEGTEFIPKRQFMGFDPELTAKIKDKISQSVSRCFKS